MTATIPRGKPAGRPAELFEIPVERILLGDNVRADVGDVRELAASIAAVGILQPIRVEEAAGDQGPGLYLLKIGHRRLAAAKSIGLTHVPAVVDARPALGASRQVEQLVENIQRADLNPLEEARALKAILDAEPKLTQKALGKRIGRSQSYVANTIGVLQAPQKVRDALASGAVTLAHVKAVAGLPAEDQTRLVDAAVSQGYSSKQTERDAKWYRERQSDRDKAAQRTAEAVAMAVPLLQKAGVATSTKVHIEAVYYLEQKAIADVVAAAGYTLSDYVAWGKRWEQCDCDAVTLVLPAGRVEPTCILASHQAARQAEEDARREKTAAEHEVQLKELVTAFEAAWDRQPADPVVGRMLLACIAGYSREKWSAYATLSPREIRKRLATSLGTHAGNYYGAAPLPMKTLIAQLRGEPAKKGRKAAADA